MTESVNQGRVVGMEFTELNASVAEETGIAGEAYLVTIAMPVGEGIPKWLRSLYKPVSIHPESL